MKTWSGCEAPLYPGAGTVSLLDLVVQLGRQRRFGGVGSLEWTVLHHSLLVALLWIRAGYPPGELHLVLLHDAHEAFTGDIPGPVKAAILRNVNSNGRFAEIPNPIHALEKALDVRIRAQLGLSEGPSPEACKRIKICDYTALVVEGVFFGAPGCDCTVDVPEALRADVRELIDLAFPGAGAAARRLGRDPGPLERLGWDPAL